MTDQTTPEQLERLRELLAMADWAKGWPHNIVPPGGHAHLLACDAIRALPMLLDTIDRLSTVGNEGLGDPQAGNHATHEPSLASRLGPAGECQAQVDCSPLSDVEREAMLVGLVRSVERGGARVGFCRITHASDEMTEVTMTYSNAAARQVATSDT